MPITRLLTGVARSCVDAAFALTGGTAINLFVRDAPRLAVDLDLVFADCSPTPERRCGEAPRGGVCLRP